ncbi:MAG: hypothetical protein AAAC48_21880 [Phyllobacterium sp.]|uniref:hypothetical protein n=1 Tax=Phyllobacterium sp. TaxID=1871046 RepID=UPI0030F0FB74
MVISSFTNAKEFDATIDNVACILINSSLAMHRRLESGAPEGFAELDKRLAELPKARDG